MITRPEAGRRLQTAVVGGSKTLVQLVPRRVLIQLRKLS